MWAKNNSNQNFINIKYLLISDGEPETHGATSEVMFDVDPSAIFTDYSFTQEMEQARQDAESSNDEEREVNPSSPAREPEETNEEQVACLDADIDWIVNALLW